MIRVGIVLVLLSALWLVAGRRVTLLLDTVLPWPVEQLPVTPLKYDGGGFVVGRLSMLFGGLDNQRFDLHLTTDAGNRVVLSTAQGSFVLGPRTSPIDSSGRPEIDFTAGTPHILSFNKKHNLGSLPTPV